MDRIRDATSSSSFRRQCTYLPELSGKARSSPAILRWRTSTASSPFIAMVSVSPLPNLPVPYFDQESGRIVFDDHYR
ncbi:MAG: hypothetical protein J0I17_07315 ['Candidatus Kapabacteria' thiocyanatum]|nr:hypothetical protein ['Candidatus Kapabacteria' thiocyanatum]